MERDEDGLDAEMKHPGDALHRAEEEPQVYSVEKGLTGWKFSRRGFLTAAATATAAAVTAATTVAGTGGSKGAISEAAEVSEDWITLEVTTGAVMVLKPDRPFTQVWKFTNKSDTTWCRGMSLHLENSDALQAPASVLVPNIAPGESIDVQVEMVAPVEPGSYHSSWHLRAADHVAPVAYSPLVFQSGCIAESPHPYANNGSQIWTVTNPDTNAQHTRVHFAQVDVETGYDHVVLQDGTAQECQRITGNYPAGLWSNLVPGRTVRVQLLTDSSVSKWGFCLDQVETAQVVYLPVVVKEFPASGPTSTPVPTKTLVPTKTRTPTPTRTPTSTPTLTSTPMTCLVESPHPYENSMDETWVVTNPDPNAQGSRVHFARLETYNSLDYVMIKDSTGVEYGRIWGSHPTGLWSVAVPGRVVQLHMRTNTVYTAWGFCADQVETTAEPPTATPTHTATPTRTPTPTHTPCPSYCSCVGYSCTCVPVHYWYPC